MLTLISPAKTLDYESRVKLKTATEARFAKDSMELIETLRPMSSTRVAALMNLSSKLADLNVQRYADFSPEFDRSNSRQSILAFKGDVYLGLDATTLNGHDLNYAQKSLRILSGLYGVLRPFDRMQPYRLEMGTPLKTRRGKNLYDFWGNSITEALNRELEEKHYRTVVNLASIEYFGVVNPDNLDARLISPRFLDEKNGEYKMISFFAKKARGSMARFLIRERVKSARKLLDFNYDGYRFDESRSTTNEPVFIRPEALAGVVDR